MWYWYLLGYVFAGAIAIIGSLTWFIIATPKRNGYDLDHWLDHSFDLLDEIVDCHQNIIEDVLGVLITAVAWPVKLAWLVREVYPTVIERYDELLILEEEES